MLMVWGAQSLFGGRSGSSVLGWVLTTQVIAWAAWLWIFRSPTLPLPHIAWSLAFRGVAALSAPLLEDDWARYLWDGWRFIESGSPYGVAPLAFFQDPTVPELLQNRLSEINDTDWYQGNVLYIKPECRDCPAKIRVNNHIQADSV
jgi:hypothetical protein